jgi:hypothetical protein
MIIVALMRALSEIFTEAFALRVELVQRYPLAAYEW